MKRTSLIAVLIATLVSSYASGPVNAYVSSVNFIGAFYRGNDTFYGTSVVAYEAGANVSLAVSVENDYYDYNLSSYRPVNVSAVKIGFDWGINYSSTEVSEANPTQIQPWEMYVFTIALTLPTNVSNLVTHSYTIYVEHVDRLTGTTKGIVGTWTYSGSNFAVYSADQADAQDLYRQLVGVGLVTDAPYYYYPQYPIMNFPYLPIVSSEARMLWTNARTEASIGSTYYTRGKFADAKAYYQIAYDMANQSLAIETTKSTSLEDTFSDLMSSTAQAMNTTAESSETFADALMKMADSSTTQAQAFLILSIGVSIGVVLVGFGALLYGLAKRKIAQTSASEE